jgi:hypothetical protein
MDIKIISKHFTSTLAALGTVSLLTSYIYNYCFFWGLKDDFSHVAITFGDVSQSFLYWLPGSFVFFIIIILTILLFDPFRPIKTSNDLTNLKKDLGGITFLRKSLPYLAALSCIVYILGGDIMESSARNGIFFLFLLATLYAGDNLPTFLVKHSIIKSEQILISRIFIYYSIAFLGYSGLHGYDESQKLLNATPTTAIITVNSKDKINSNILRTLDKGVLIGTKDSPIDFIPWSAITNIRIVSNSKMFRGVMCKWFGSCTPYQKTTNSYKTMTSSI